MLVAAAKTEYLSSEVVHALFVLRRNVNITEDVLFAAAADRLHGERNIRMIGHLEQAKKVRIAEPTLFATVKHRDLAPATLQILLDECGDLVNFQGGFESVILKAAAKLYDFRVQTLLEVMLENNRVPLMIAKSVIVAAMKSSDERYKVRLLCRFSNEARQICRSLGGDFKDIVDKFA